MLISYEHRFLFVHVPKAAGSSVRAALSSLAPRAPDRLLNNLLAHSHLPLAWRQLYRLKRFSGHARARDIRRELPRDIWDGLFKFAFVRNPWDRLVSSYHYILRRPHHHRYRKVAALPDFAGYVEYELRRGKFLQHDMLSDRHGKLLVDFVGRVECQQQDFARICAQIGIEAQLPHSNRTAHAEYQSHYDTRTRELVARHLARDVECFGYTFTGCRPMAA